MWVDESVPREGRPSSKRAKKPPKKQKRQRARQNLILEVGYFWGRLGRGNVAVLCEAGLELPSDIQGLGTIDITSDLGETKRKLRIELEQAGLLQGR